MTYNRLNSFLYALHIMTDTSDHLKTYKPIAIRDNESLKIFTVLRKLHCTIQTFNVLGKVHCTIQLVICVLRFNLFAWNICKTVQILKREYS